MITHLFHTFKFRSLRKKIKKNPSLGKLDIDATYLHREGLYALKYRLVKDASGKVNVEWISQKRYFNTYEEWIRRIRKNFFKLWHYQKWFIFFRPPIFLLVIISVSIFYFGILETQKIKVERLKWIIAKATGASPKQIEYIGNGWLQITSERKTIVDRKTEPLKYKVNPFMFFFAKGESFVSRWRGKPFDYTTHPIVYNEFGEVWIYKDGSWRSGKISANTINWDAPQGTGIRRDKVLGEEIVNKKERLKVKDK